MKILKIKRGYTTNSSSGNEWALPPRDHPQYREFYDYLKREGRLPAGTLPPLEPGTGQAVVPPAGAEAAEGATNLGLMGALVGTVCFLFVAGGLVRRYLKRRLSDDAGE